jgi:hypothetical protein
MPVNNHWKKNNNKAWAFHACMWPYKKIVNA